MSDLGCNTTCGDGVRTITRDRDPPLGTNLHDGIPCDGEDKATMPCNLLDEAEATAAKQGRQIDMLRLCASECSTELPANYEQELACTELLPTECSDVTKEWIEKTGMMHSFWYGTTMLIWDGQDCTQIVTWTSREDFFNLQYCQNVCLDDVNTCNAVNYYKNTISDYKYCQFYDCNPGAEPTAESTFSNAKAYIYT